MTAPVVIPGRVDLWTTITKLRAAFSRETSELPEQWLEANPSTGQCHVSALVLQDLHGGLILEGLAYEDDESGPSTKHYWNVIDGVTIDITRDQFPFYIAVDDVYLADPPNKTTREKADLLAQLAGVA